MSGTDGTSRMLTGRCECRAVGYRVPDAFLYSGNCHCSNCRASTGSAFKPFAGIERDKLEIVQGGDTLLVWGDDNENHTRCGVCGSLLYSVAAMNLLWQRAATSDTRDVLAFDERPAVERVTRIAGR